MRKGYACPRAAGKRRRRGGNAVLAFAAMKKFLLAAACALAAVASAVQTPRAPAAAPSGTDPAFAKFVDDYFDSRYASSPLEGTAAGFHPHDAKMQDLSRAGFAKRIAELKAQLQHLSAFDRATLAFDDAIDAEALEGEIRAELLDLETLQIWADATRCATPGCPAAPSTG